MKHLSIYLFIAGISLISFLLPTNSFGQYIPIGIEQKKSQSSHIIEGKVIGTETFRSGIDIYTLNHIQVIQSVKGDATAGSILDIITSGGILDGETQSWTHMPSL